MNHSIRFASVLLALAFTASCGGSDDASPTETPTAGGGAASSITEADRKEATAYWALCVTCHGNAGHGDGPGSAALNPKPRSFADVTWQDSVTDEHIKTTILLGGAAVGKSPAMPPNPVLKGKDGVLSALVEKVRSFRGK